MRLWIRNLVCLGFCLVAAGLAVRGLLLRPASPGPQSFDAARFGAAEFFGAAEQVDRSFASHWNSAHLEPAPVADDLTLARRLSLALTGTIPSLEELRALEARPQEERIPWWLTRLFEDRRYGDYLAERFARMLVGVEDGPFIFFRRHRFTSWLSDRLMANRPYDEIVRDLLTAEGIWTSRPEVNFMTVTVDPNAEEKALDPVKLAGRVSKAFLGVRLDCVQCHDDFMGGPWKQRDFHQMAAFFAPAEMSLTGVRDNAVRTYEHRYLGRAESEPVPAQVPFHQELLPAEGPLRSRLAAWVTHPDNRPFARAMVNRTWALLFNRPLRAPVDHLSLDGPFPPGMEELADDLIAHRFDLQRLIRVIAATAVFRRASGSDDAEHPVTEEQAAAFAAFPLTRLRPEQVAGSVLQSANLRTINADSHVLVRLVRFFQQQDFIKRYGDAGEDEFGVVGGTIPQRLILMNGQLVQERTKEDLAMNSATRIGVLAPDDATAIETAYLTVLTRRPAPAERDHFLSRFEDRPAPGRSQKMEDLFWTLINSTEFSWNH